MPTAPVLLDALTLYFVLAFALSAIAGGLAWAVPAGRLSAREARRLLFLPPVAALLLVGLGFWPSLRAGLGGAPDHCAAETAGHPHLCWLHGAGSPAQGASHDVAALVVLVVVAGVALWQAFRWGQGYGRLRLLESVASPERERDVRRALAEAHMAWPGPLTVVAFEQPLCFVAGAFRPRLFLSTAVLDAMAAEDVRVMVAHELAHVERRDNLWRLAGHGALLFQLPGLGHRALNRWLHAAEEACDESAARRLGSRLGVAEALVRFQRLVRARGLAAPLGMAFGHAGTLDARVRRLLAPPAAPAPGWVASWPWALLLVALSQADALHAALEACLRVVHF